MKITFSCIFWRVKILINNFEKSSYANFKTFCKQILITDLNSLELHRILIQISYLLLERGLPQSCLKIITKYNEKRSKWSVLKDHYYLWTLSKLVCFLNLGRNWIVKQIKIMPTKFMIWLKLNSFQDSRLVGPFPNTRMQHRPRYQKGQQAVPSSPVLGKIIFLMCTKILRWCRRMVV